MKAKRRSKAERLNWLPLEEANEAIKKINLKDLKGKTLTEEEIIKIRGANNNLLLVPWALIQKDTLSNSYKKKIVKMELIMNLVSYTNFFLIKPS